MHVANVLAGGVVGDLAFLAIAGLVNTQHDRALPQGAAGELQAHRPQCFHRPVGIGNEMVQRLRIRFRGLGQPRQRLAFGLCHQAELKVGELFKLPDVGKDRAVVGAVVVDEGDDGDSFSQLSHGVVSCLLNDEDNAHTCRHYAHSDRRATVTRIARSLAGSGGLSLPGSLVFDHGIEDGQQLVHACHQGDLLRFASRQETFVEQPDGEIAAGGAQGTHVDGCAHRSTAAPDRPSAAQGAAITIERSHSDQRGDLAVREPSQLGQFRQHGQREGRPDAPHALQQVDLLAPALAG